MLDTSSNAVQLRSAAPSGLGQIPNNSKAYLDRSERTVRRWEASEGLPVHRREHEKQDTVFAYRHEIEAWGRLRTKCPREISIR
jgi:hypothetical protein